MSTTCACAMSVCLWFVLYCILFFVAQTIFRRFVFFILPVFSSSFFCIFAVDSYVSCTTVCICFNAPANQPYKNSNCLQQVNFMYYEFVIILFIDSQRHCSFIIIFFLRNMKSETYNCFVNWMMVNSFDRYPIQLHSNGNQLNIVSC